MSSPVATGYFSMQSEGMLCEEHGHQRSFVWLDQPEQAPFTNYCPECVAGVVKDFLTPMEYTNARD